jgi:SET domain-containing protein
MNKGIFFCNTERLKTFGKPSFNPKDIESPILNDKVYVNKSDVHGWGVFAKQKIKKGELIEKCPVIIEENYHLGYNSWDSLIYYQFVFNVPLDHNNNLFATSLGFGSLYNHNDEPNANWAFYIANVKLILFYATREIKKDEEIFIWYGDIDPQKITWIDLATNK